MRPFAEARDYVRTLNLKNREEWRAYSKSTTKPPDIPGNPEKVYREQWNGMGGWLGTGTLRPQDMKFLPFEKAKEFVHSLGLKNQTEWKKYCKSGKRPSDIPSNPNKIYEKDWKGMGDWLGTGTIASQNRTYKSFDEAKKFVQSLGLKSQAEWDKYCKSGKKPTDIPANPPSPYKEYSS